MWLFIHFNVSIYYFICFVLHYTQKYKNLLSQGAKEDRHSKLSINYDKQFNKRGVTMSCNFKYIHKKNALKSVITCFKRLDKNEEAITRTRISIPMENNFSVPCPEIFFFLVA